MRYGSPLAIASKCPALFVGVLMLFNCCLISLNLWSSLIRVIKLPPRGFHPLHEVQGRRAYLLIW